MVSEHIIYRATALRFNYETLSLIEGDIVKVNLRSTGEITIEIGN